jgi:hypothetical protein
VKGEAIMTKSHDHKPINFVGLYFIDEERYETGQIIAQITLQRSGHLCDLLRDVARPVMEITSYAWAPECRRALMAMARSRKLTTLSRVNHWPSPGYLASPEGSPRSGLRCF